MQNEPHVLILEGELDGIGRASIAGELRRQQLELHNEGVRRFFEAYYAEQQRAWEACARAWQPGDNNV